MSGGSLEKLTRAVTYWQYICFLRLRGFFRGVPGFLGGVPGFLRGVPGFLGVFLVFLGVFRVFLGVFRFFLGCSWFSWECSWFFGGVRGFSGVPECSVMFRCSGVPCSGVPGSTTCRFCHAFSKMVKRMTCTKIRNTGTQEHRNTLEHSGTPQSTPEHRNSQKTPEHRI